MIKKNNYMLDTNICIFLIKNTYPTILEKIEKLEPTAICISSITLSELYFGVAKSQPVHRDKNKKNLEKMLSILEIISYNKDASLHYGEIRADLEKKGQIIGPLDMLIAAHAMSEGCILVTNNTKEFKRINSLKVEDWTK